MKHIVLICHKDHFVSGSVNFIKKLLERKFTVEIVAGDIDIHHVQPLTKTHSEAIFVLWQMEFLAPWLTSKGIKVVAFPMFDGCENAPNSYFKILDNVYLFSFSKRLHQKSMAAGVVSYQLNWYPTKKEAKTIKAKEDRLFFWQRRPNSSLSESNIVEYFSQYVNSIHIHDRPDGYQLTDSSIIPNQYTSTSNWFEKKEDLFHLISSSKYYIAPRESEGIGMAFLEAMNEGCIVFANRKSTHDQYIYNGYNGFLIDFESKNKKLIKKQLKEAFKIIHSGKPIGENAKEFMLKGADIWKEQSEKILEILKTIDDANPIKPANKFEQKLGYMLARSYYKNPKLYFVLTDVLLKGGIFTDELGKNKIKMILVLLGHILKRIFRLKR